MQPLTINVSEATGGHYVVSFPLYSPPVRYDKVPWSRVRIEESANDENGWVELATAGIDPVDRDPAHPCAHGITLIGATLRDGWYRVTWLDAQEGQAVFPPIAFNQEQLPPTPSLEEVAALMRAHVADGDNNQLETFTEDTSPTAEQVQLIIQTVRQEVATRLRSEVPVRYMDAARYVVAIGAVAYIEQSVHPEAVHVKHDESTFSTSRTIFLGRLSDLAQACKDEYYPLVR